MKMSHLRDCYERALREFGSSDDGEWLWGIRTAEETCLLFHFHSNSSFTGTRCWYLWKESPVLAVRLSDILSVMIIKFVMWIFFWRVCRSVDGLHQRGAGYPWQRWELWETPLEGHEEPDRRECGALRDTIHTAADRSHLIHTHTHWMC